mmetsp:Transcript_39969/g.89831  ORF Transcript_39969/g.89831 Transcript_39969/m.89831 type:complete len:282 (+) Transcript_39969:49-894(+)
MPGTLATTRSRLSCNVQSRSFWTMQQCCSASSPSASSGRFSSRSAQFRQRSLVASTAWCEPCAPRRPWRWAWRWRFRPWPSAVRTSTSLWVAGTLPLTPRSGVVGARSWGSSERASQDKASQTCARRVSRLPSRTSGRSRATGPCQSSWLRGAGEDELCGGSSTGTPAREGKRQQKVRAHLRRWHAHLRLCPRGRLLRGLVVGGRWPPDLGRPLVARGAGRDAFLRHQQEVLRAAAWRPLAGALEALRSPPEDGPRQQAMGPLCGLRRCRHAGRNHQHQRH